MGLFPYLISLLNGPRELFKAHASEAPLALSRVETLRLGGFPEGEIFAWFICIILLAFWLDGFCYCVAYAYTKDLAYFAFVAWGACLEIIQCHEYMLQRCCPFAHNLR
jgi:hypothetical protein